MKGDWPGGVRLANVMVRLPSVCDPLVVSRRETFSERYWSSLFPPRLMMSAISEDGWSWPETPAPLQAASVLGSADQRSTWRPSAADGERVGHGVELEGPVLEGVQGGRGERRELVDPGPSESEL